LSKEATGVVACVPVGVAPAVRVRVGDVDAVAVAVPTGVNVAHAPELRHAA